MSRNFTAYLEICKRSLTEILLSGRDQLFSFSQFQHFQYGLRCSVLRPVIDNNNFLRWHRLIQQTPQFSETKDCRRQRAEPRKVQRAASVQSRELNFRFPLSAFRFSAFRFKAFACSSAHVPIVGPTIVCKKTHSLKNPATPSAQSAPPPAPQSTPHSPDYKAHIC